jgi:sterol 24-C-methyltransferase
MLHSPVPKSEGEINKSVTQYEKEFQSEESRVQKYAWITNTFYDLVTDFYEYGWGQSFHFAPRARDETFAESLKRHEHFLALRLQLNPNKTCLDLGSGIGGPLREIGRISGAKVTGINNNAYQIKKANENIMRAGLAGQCNFVKADFMNLPYGDGTIDAAYQIEATCHAPDRTGCYKEVCRILKPGGLFSGYEWVTTPEYNPNNPQHARIVRDIELGNGISPLKSTTDIIQSLKDAGFVVEEAMDLALDARFPIPWYQPLAGDLTISGFRHSRIGRFFTHNSVNILEKCRIVPQGTTKVSSLLMMTADALVEGGRLGIFTPCYYYLARKPDTSDNE